MRFIIKFFSPVKGGFLKILKKLGFIESVHYINGVETLPPPLTKSQEEKIMSNIRAGIDGAREPLITHNLRLVVYIAKKFESTKINIEDLISIGSMGLIKGVQTFKAEKNIKLATYASRCIENEILMYLRKTHRSRQEVSLDEVLSIDSEGNEMILADILSSEDDQSIDEITKKESINNIYSALNKLKPREKEIITLRFGLFETEPLTQKEVADLLGISQSYISRLEKRIIDKMRREIDNKVKVS